MAQTQIDPNHAGPQSVLRMLGPVVLIAGIVLLILGAIQMFSPAWSSGPDTSGFMEGKRSIDDIQRQSRDDFGDKAKSSFVGFGMVAGGMVLLVVGIGLTRMGYIGRVARYMAQEIAPVATDTFNYVATGTQPGVQTMAKSISEGIAEGIGAAKGRAGAAVAPPAATNANALGHAVAPASAGAAATPVQRECPACRAANPLAARFCGQCGAALPAAKACPKCQAINEPSAHFCDDCGQALGM